MDTRRSFIGKAAAFAAAAIISPLSRLLRSPRNQDGTWRDVDTMLDAMFEHCQRTGAEAIPCDSSDRWGYTTFLPDAPGGFDDSRIWQMRLSDVSPSMDRLRKRSPRQAQTLAAVLRTAEGRRAIAQACSMGRRPEMVAITA